MKDLIFFPAGLLVQGIRLGVFSARDVLDAYVDHVKKRNPELNALVTLDEAGARRRAIEADEARAQGDIWGPLHGLPVTVQDNLSVKEMRSTSGDPALAKYIPEEDAPLVSRLRETGAIVLGKTNVSPISRGAYTTNPVFGTSNNPWNPARSTGGGGGGGAASVAAGLSGLDFGIDTGGSVRIPAALCGVFALMLTAGRIPVEEEQAIEGAASLGPMSAPGFMARSIQDLNLAYLALTGSRSPDSSAAGRKFKDRQIAWTDDFGSMPLSEEIKAALQEFTGALSRQGAKVERQPDPGLDLIKAWEIGGALIGGTEAPISGGVSRLLRRFFGSKDQQTTPGSPILRGMEIGPDVFRRREAIEQLALARKSMSNAFDRFFATWDVWICPVFPTTAISNDGAQAADRMSNPSALKMDVDGQPVSQIAAGLAFNLLFNLTGNPAIVFPIAESKEGLPIGVQMVGRRGMEADLLSLAETIAEIGCGYQRPPRLE